MSQYRRTITAPVLPIAPSPVIGHKRKLMNPTKTEVTSIPRRDTAPATLTAVDNALQQIDYLKPSEYWKCLLEEWKIPILDTVGIEQCDDETDPDKKAHFLETTADRVEAYQNIELLTAVRRRDLVTLKKIAEENRASGSTMNACNRFGESILHLACRKGSLDVVQLLVGSSNNEGCGCSLLLRDDYGRTVLHDACWTVNPPWELIKLILRKAPVLWRVSDVRGHLALQYVPKAAWPQWSAFLSKNRELLKRIMVHSYHNIDILQQPQTQAQTQTQTQQVPSPLPQQQQQQSHQPPPPVKVPVAVSQHFGTNDEAAVPPQQLLPQHSRPPMTMPPVPNPVFTYSTTAQQAQDVLSRVLAQASPAMVQAISQGSVGQPQQQGLTTFASAQQQHQHQPSTTPEAAEPVQVVVPGPATAALDEALRAISSNRKVQQLQQQQQQSSNLLLTEEPEHAQQQQPQQAEHPLPYAPSISMIEKRLKEYQKQSSTNKNTNQAVKQEDQPSPPQETSPSETVNPLPAVPNPLLTRSSLEEKAQAPPPPQQQGVPSSITTIIKNDSMGVQAAVAGSAEEAPQEPSNNNNNNDSIANQSNSVSSVTMSAVQSLLEGNGSDTTMKTDTDSDRAVATSSPSNQTTEAAALEAGSNSGGEDNEGYEKKSSPSQKKKTVIG